MGTTEREDGVKKLEKAVSSIVKLKPAAVYDLVETYFCELYASSCLKILRGLGVKPIEINKDGTLANIHFLEKVPSWLKQHSVRGIGYRIYNDDSFAHGGNLLEENGSFYEFWCYYDDDWIDGGKALNCYAMSFYSIQNWEEFYNCLRQELNRQNSKTKKA